MGSSPTAPAPSAKTKPGGTTPAESPATIRYLRVLAENLECLAIAIVMALILKFFLIEAYKIPSGSMQPTIMGDQDTRIFDRVLVNKLLYFLREPERWEVAVFKMPLVQRQNYIKRVVGKPGEKITIRNGDVFVQPLGQDQDAEFIARKPDQVWKSVRKEIIPDFRDGRTLVQLMKDESDDGSVTIAEEEIRLQPRGSSEAVVAVRQPIRDVYYHGYDPKWVPTSKGPPVPDRYHVSDVEIDVTVEPEASQGSLDLHIREAGLIHRARLDFAAQTYTLEVLADEQGRSTPFDVEAIRQQTSATGALEVAAGEDIDVVFRNVDDELVFLVDGKELERRPYTTTGLNPDRKTKVEMRAQGGSVLLSDLQVYRDIHYTGPQGARNAQFEVAEGEYFALGDNTQNSADCRSWEIRKYVLHDGTELHGNHLVGSHNDANPRYDGRDVLFQNYFGEFYRFPRGQVREELNEPYHKIPEEFLLGKAMAVFWPLPPFSPSWRLKWVR